MLKLKHFIATAIFAMGISAVSAETIYVVNGNDSGAGSLRQAITDANSNASATTILIKIPGALGAERIINVTTALPSFTAPVELRIDGTQTGKAVLLAPIINGPGAATTGITFDAGSAGSSVQNITFRSFVFSVVLNTGNILVNNVIFEDNQGGIDVRLLSAGAGGNTITGNQFTTTHSAYGVAGISGGNVIKGNSFIGEGISIGATGTQIGGTGNADANTFTNISGDAIYLNNGSGTVILHNTFNGATGNGINITSGNDIQIEQNNFSNITGWDIQLANGFYNRVNLNQIQGNNGVFNGINIHDAQAIVLNNNWVTGGSIELTNVTSSIQGPLRITSNTIVNDPQGFSGHGSLSLTGVQNAYIFGNYIHNNGGNGIYLYQSTNNTILSNQLYENFRAGIVVGSELYNKISKNLIYNNHADVYGGRTGIFATAKAAPVITSAKRVGLNFILSGNGTVSGDSVEIFLSDAASRNSVFVQNAISYKASILATGATWTATIPVGPLNGGDVYFIATATNTVNTTSSFSRAVGVEINGPTSATINIPATYAAENIPGASYSWWSTLPISSLVQNGNQATFTFNQAGIGTVSVGYTDPGTGQWKQYSLAVTVSNNSRTGADASVLVANEVLAYPNPFTSQLNVTLEGPESISVFLYNSNGEVVHHSEGHQHGETIEIGNNITNGVYTLKTISGSEVKTSRIVKQF